MRILRQACAKFGLVLISHKKYSFLFGNMNKLRNGPNIGQKIVHPMPKRSAKANERKIYRKLIFVVQKLVFSAKS